MTHREKEALIRQMEQLSPAAYAYVSGRIGRRLKELTPSAGKVVFCVESVPRDDPILREIQTWVDESNFTSMPRKTEEVATYVSNRCGRCGASDHLKTCERCGLVRYCGRECQVADWRRHKNTCRPRESMSCFTAGNVTLALLPERESRGPARLVPSDQEAIVAQHPGEYARTEVAAIFKDMGDNGYSSKEVRRFIEAAAANGQKVRR
tara:strand:- start:434 stop:1057 length:624 start_codon:yes stop_codon:yes gene_type:complete